MQAYQYLLELPGLTSLHAAEDTSIRWPSGSSGAAAAAVTAAAMPIPSLPGVSLPEVGWLMLCYINQADPNGALPAGLLL